jgi:O-succinylbenzoate synthase
MELSVVPYQLVGKRGRQIRAGALLRWRSGERLAYGGLSAWESLGDESLAAALESYRGPRQGWTRLAQASFTNLTSLATDRSAASPDDPVVASSALIGWEARSDTELRSDFVQAVSDGFRVVKLKLDAIDDARWGWFLSSLDEQLSKAPAASRVRLDFNARWTVDQVRVFWDRLSPELRRQVDYIEDPCPRDVLTWKQLAAEGVPLAIDMVDEEALDEPLHDLFSFVDTLVWKPARQSLELARNWPRRLVVTSYLDHPLTERRARQWALRLRADETHGVSTSRLFQPDSATAKFWSNPSGTERLESLSRLPWQIWTPRADVREEELLAACRGLI